MSILYGLRSRLMATRTGVASFALVATMWAVPAAAQMSAEHRPSQHREKVVFTVDVAENLERFSPTFTDPQETELKRGTFFVTEGNIYPVGTIQGDGGTFDPTSEGAIGRWFCDLRAEKGDEVGPSFQVMRQAAMRRVTTNRVSSAPPIHEVCCFSRHLSHPFV